MKKSEGVDDCTLSKIMKPGFSALVTDHDENSDIDDNEDDCYNDAMII